MLEPRPRLPPELAQRLVGGALERAFRRYARRAWRLAVILWVVGLALRITGPG